MRAAFVFFFFFQAEDGIRDVAVTGVQTCALPILFSYAEYLDYRDHNEVFSGLLAYEPFIEATLAGGKLQRLLGTAATCNYFEVLNEHPAQDRKSTRLNSSHGYISYAVFCLKKKNTTTYNVTLHELTA